MRFLSWFRCQSPRALQSQGISSTYSSGGALAGGRMPTTPSAAGDSCGRVIFRQRHPSEKRRKLLEEGPAAQALFSNFTSRVDTSLWSSEPNIASNLSDVVAGLKR